MTLKKTIKAGVSLLVRLVFTPLRSVANWINMKRLFWGKVRFNSSVRIALSSSFEGANAIGDNSSFSGTMGYGTYMCNDCSIIGNVGRFCSIAPEVKNSIGVHPINAPYVSTSPMFFSLRKQSGETFALKQMFNLNDKSKILIVGLGNEKIIADSLGPCVADKVMVTNHLYKIMSNK